MRDHYSVKHNVKDNTDEDWTVAGRSTFSTLHKFCIYQDLRDRGWRSHAGNRVRLLPVENSGLNDLWLAEPGREGGYASRGKGRSSMIDRTHGYMVHRTGELSK